MGKLVPCVRECRNFISDMSGLVWKVIAGRTKKLDWIGIQGIVYVKAG